MSTPTYPEYEGLRELAGASVLRDGRFVDPVKRRMLSRLGRTDDWVISVLGQHRPVTVLDMHMLLLANGLDLEPPLPDWLAELRAKQQAERERQEAERAARLRAIEEAWTAIWERLPQQIRVAYNYSGGLHLEMYQSGAVHILLTEDLTFGRLRRDKGGAMCTTASNAKHQLFDGGDCGPAERTPTCEACLRTAAKVAGVPLASILLT